MHRRRLPIVDPCTRSLAAMPLRAAGRRWCETCEHEVLDLSALSEAEARAVLRAKLGESICVAYRVDSSGELAFRDRAPRGWVLAAALAVSGCLGFDSPELELPDEPEPALWPTDARVPEAEPEPVDPSPTGESGSFRLLVRAAGQPFADANIDLEAAGERWTGTSDGEGRWSVSELPAGTYALRVEHGELAAQVRVEVRPGEASSARVDFSPTPDIVPVVGALKVDEEALVDAKRLPLGKVIDPDFTALVGELRMGMVMTVEAAAPAVEDAPVVEDERRSRRERAGRRGRPARK
ncbi:carboxypeptidase regulatory-like domain-containing protein [Nannocystaceae bacterium ST9]